MDSDAHVEGINSAETRFSWICAATDYGRMSNLVAADLAITTTYFAVELP